MRLSGILSKEPQRNYYQIEGFLNQKLKIGNQRKIEIGRITLPFYCKKCEDTLTFASIEDNLICTGINERIVSITTALKCVRCDAVVPVWFLVESDEKTMFTQFPKVRVLKRTYNLLNDVLISNEEYGQYSILLEKAKIAYYDGLGAGAIIYLRKIYEAIVKETADIYGINMKTAKGGRRKFSEVLEEVDSEASIIPTEFTKNRYRLFNDLSNIIHGEYDEETALNQYPAFYRLVIGILDNIKNNKEILKAIKELDWDMNGDEKK